MIPQIKKIHLLLSFLLLAITASCRTENDLIINPPTETTIEANSNIANLMSKIAMKDGSLDNIIDSASNLSVQLPITVTANGVELEITNKDGYDDIENIFDLSDADVDTLIIHYPITVILPDFSTIIVNSKSELQALTENFGASGDIDIECIDFQYPLTIFYFSEKTDSNTSVTINTDKEMFNFIGKLNELTAVTINFPITVTYPDFTTEIANNVQELENAVALADNTCDEDDDNDYNDDDCVSCSLSELNNAFATCQEWNVDKLKLNNKNLENNYIDYVFTFNSNGTITITENGNTFSGTWAAVGTAEGINLTINIAGLPDFNGTWSLQKINLEPVASQIELRIGVDRLRFVSSC